MKFDPAMLEILACPTCKGGLKLVAGDRPGLNCSTCRLSYPLVDGIPDLLPESGRSLDEQG
jgi:uncharacterized protein